MDLKKKMKEFDEKEIKKKSKNRGFLISIFVKFQSCNSELTSI